jgi:ABC-type phosphate/phosphonate transport system substrate-binding protein
VKDFKEHRFFQVLKEGQYQLIKMPIKKLIEADYKAVYGADRRYDEYTTYYKYYIMNPDSTFHQIQLTKKSLIKLFPNTKELINNTIESKTYTNDEDMVIDFLNKF